MKIRQVIAAWPGTGCLERKHHRVYRYRSGVWFSSCLRAFV